jgi:HAD superfamily hydrolase (TIGR01509 family)
MTLRALIWDVDGTLAETERDGHRIAFNEAFEALGVPWRWSESHYGDLLHVTGGRERLLHDMRHQPQAPITPSARDDLARQLHRLKNECYARIVAAGGISLRPGVAALMADCRAAGLPMAIATTTSRSNVEALLGSHAGPQWEDAFAAVVCAEEAPLKKPDPQAYLETLRRLGLRAEDALAIEDSSPGVRACRAAGVAVVVTRSVYFAQADVSGALAVGPDLGSQSGWQAPGASRPDEGHVLPRVDLACLARWFSQHRGASES